MKSNMEMHREKHPEDALIPDETITKEKCPLVTIPEYADHEKAEQYCINSHADCVHCWALEVKNETI